MVRLRYYWVLGFLLLLAYTSYFNISRGLVDGALAEVLLAEEEWIQTASKFPQIESHRFFLLKEKSTNPQVNSVLARITHNCYLSPSRCENLLSEREASNSSLSFYRASIEQRPSWARTHANLVQLKNSMGQFDSELLASFAAAVKFGPYEPSTLDMIALVGLSNWHAFEEEQRKQNVSLFLDALWGNRKSISRRQYQNLKEQIQLGYSQLDPMLAVEAMRRTERENDLTLKAEFKRFSAFWVLLNQEQKTNVYERVLLLTKIYGEKKVMQEVVRFQMLTQFCPVLPRTSYMRKQCDNRRIR